MLDPIVMPDAPKPPEPERGSDSPTVVCAACQRPGKSHLMINCVICSPSPGHPDILGIGCGEHWACSIECWRKVAHACIDEHMVKLLQYWHKKVGR